MDVGGDSGFDPTDRARWGREGFGAPGWSEDQYSLYDDDFYGGDDFYAGDAPRGGRRARRLGSLVGLVIVVIVAFVLLGQRDGGDDDGGERATPAASDAADSDQSGGDDETSAVGDGEEPAARTTTGNPDLDALFEALGVRPDLDDPRAGVVVDELGDLIDSISANTPAYTGDDIDIARSFSIRLDVSPAAARVLFNESTVECGQGEPFVVVCDPAVSPMPAGDVLMLGAVLQAPAAEAGTDHSYIYSAVFDSDGDPANDWRTNPPFDFDLFQGADRWYELSWNHHLAEWALGVSQVDAGQQINPTAGSAARVVVAGDTVVFLVPEVEVAGSGAYRLTAFGHDGAFSEDARGADVSGVDPAEALSDPPDETVEAGVPSES